MPQKLFCYGSLEFPEVIERVVGRRPEPRLALLPGFRRAMVRSRDYPGITLDTAYGVSGTLYLGLTKVEMRRLDRFEGREYRRMQVRVRTRRGMERCWTYLPRADMAPLDERPWDAERFATNDMRGFLNRTARDGSRRRG